MANLRCRMFQNRYPRRDDLVMIRVDSIDVYGASVSLMEYDNMEGRIEDISCGEITVVGRIQPVRVLRVDRRVEEHVFILLSSPSSVPSYLRDDHVYKYDKNRFVQTILREVARIRGCDLEEVYRLTAWVSYENLTDRDSLFWRNISPDDLKDQLVERLDTILVKSWRLMRPELLNLNFIGFHPRIMLCWAYALIRQFEAQLKLNDLLEPDEYLSIQDLVNKCHEHVDQDGDMESLGDARDAMVYYGIVKEKYVPLSWSLNIAGRTADESVAAVYRVKEMKIVSDTDFKTAEDWDRHIEETVLIHPIACSVLWFHSYSQNAGGRRYYIPTAAELEAYEADPLSHDLPVHTMLLTGPVTHVDGTRLWEFQDNTSDVNNGDRGFLYFARFPNPIIEHAQLELEDEGKESLRF